MTRWCGTTDSVLWLDPAWPNSTRLTLLVEEAGRNSSNSSVQYAAPWSVLTANA